MRLVILMASLVIVSLLVIKGYSGAGTNKGENPASKEQTDPTKRASDVNQIIQDTANKQKQAIEKQIQQ